MQILAAVMSERIGKANFAFLYPIAPEYSDAQFEIILSALDGLAEPHYIECYYLLSGVVD